MWLFKFSYRLLEMLTKQLMIKHFLQSVGFNFVDLVSPASQKSSVFIKANKAFTCIFVVFVALVRFYLLHYSNNYYWATVKKNKIEDKVDLLKKVTRKERST